MYNSPTRRSRRSFSRNSQKSKPYSRSHPRSRKNGAGKYTKQNKANQAFDVSQYINTNVVAEAEAPYTPEHAFTDFGLSKELTKTITSLKLTEPTPIQDQVIPHILAGTDVVGLANTGTGKTAAFLIPLIERTLAENTHCTLILTPTRELAIQIKAELDRLAKGMDMHATVCVGGMPIGPQMRSLKKKNHFIIGTPGRVLDLIGRGNITPNTVNAVVLDEADRMLDMGFIHDMRKILADIPQKRQMLLFSATMPTGIKTLVSEFLHEPETISVKKNDTIQSIAQDVVRYGKDDKFDTLLNLLSDDSFSRVLIFGAMKHSVEKLSKQLKARGVQAESIHGNKTHAQRQRALKQFKNANARVLVATDVAARGIHVDQISHVINYDLPSTYEDYIHRIGRTGRGNNAGKALTFVQ